MRTPIADFVNKYRASETVRLHMPGHKGVPLLGPEPFDITEVAGADALYEAEGIIRESEENAASLFGTRRTVFSAEGSSQCIRAMLFLAATRSDHPERPLFVAGRNAHKTFLYGAALMNAEVVWLRQEGAVDLCRAEVTPVQLAETLKALPERPAAVYITSPDYLGNEADIRDLAEVCHRYGTLLLVDNAHGAYLKFLSPSRHPMDLGADLACDSAHKTLPALTGAAYLHLSKSAPEGLEERMKQAMALFGSTSPSYLIMASLDLCNKVLSENYEARLAGRVKDLGEVRGRLRDLGWTVPDTDPLKLTLRAPEGLTGTDLAECLRRNGLECEFADPDYLVLMITPDNSREDLDRIPEILGENRRPCGKGQSWILPEPEQVMPVRQAVFASCDEISVDAAEGRIAATPTVSCPPAIPVVCSGERITREAVEVMHYYGIREISVVRE